MLAQRLFTAVAAFSLLTPISGVRPSTRPPDAARTYSRMVQRVADMVNDDRAYTLTNAFGLELLDVLWEDTGRWEGSSVGPNISDVTIEVEAGGQGKRRRTYLMPVMRYANFTDKTADIKIDKILVPVGNQRDGGELELVSIKQLLENPEQYMSTSDQGRIKGGSLLAEDSFDSLLTGGVAIHVGEKFFAGITGLDELEELLVPLRLDSAEPLVPAH